MGFGIAPGAGPRAARMVSGCALAVALSSGGVAAADPGLIGGASTGSAITGSGGTGSGVGSADSGGVDTGSQMSLHPPLSAGETARHRDESLAVPPKRTLIRLDPEPIEAAAPPALNSGSVQTACAGSAVTGLGLILLGLMTGSGPGSSLVGVGGSSLVGGSSGSGLGSAALGSAITGSAIITCLLPGPPPPAPELPLQIGPLPAVPVFAPPAPTAPVPLPPPPAPAPPPPPARRLPPPVASEQATADGVAWNLLELMAVLVSTVLIGVRTRTADVRARRPI
ncbi:hypothetical protein [Nocardia sp. alder85J]|uniref:hypothetical protein n=1 Tax=Nocardia sp. alder85J TaxID=2862949 RepID=UPI001CD6A655|nr:hypothetical protein [Nocardia sp. alder85J]MCX4097827.1 hypothetical protein [Nocardia sp. alder85J]